MTAGAQLGGGGGGYVQLSCGPARHDPNSKGVCLKSYSITRFSFVPAERENKYEFIFNTCCISSDLESFASNR